MPSSTMEDQSKIPRIPGAFPTQNEMGKPQPENITPSSPTPTTLPSSSYGLWSDMSPHSRKPRVEQQARQPYPPPKTPKVKEIRGEKKPQEHSQNRALSARPRPAESPKLDTSIAAAPKQSASLHELQTRINSSRAVLHGLVYDVAALERPGSDPEDKSTKIDSQGRERANSDDFPSAPPPSPRWYAPDHRVKTSQVYDTAMNTAKELISLYANSIELSPTPTPASNPSHRTDKPSKAPAASPIDNAPVLPSPALKPTKTNSLSTKTVIAPLATLPAAGATPDFVRIPLTPPRPSVCDGVDGWVIAPLGQEILEEEWEVIDEE
ncbi:hypothetical protein B0J11DRAFT_158133 [Dendryphion nanum]|uniref:Uncharacterized protein n=1 Tax=Dendryphion nanum TaxID=256645 RepID=A0A9P9EDY8_9PLEO|nr:hypothetical protein B0J11DRAFT_158133 [Dendryphion nanum]